MSPQRAALFLLVVTTLTAALHRFLWARLVRDPGWPAPWGQLGTVLITALAASLLFSFLLSRFGPRAVATPAAWVGYTWLGLLFYLVVGLLPLELGRAGLGVARFAGVVGEVDPGRRALLLQAAAGTVGAGAALLGLVGMWTTARGPELTRTRVSIQGLGQGLHGLRVVQITDVHLGPTIGAEFMARVVEAVNAAEPDLVVITGDLVDGSVSQLAPAAAPLAELKSRYGTFFVTGNHEYYSGAAAWVRHLGTLGIRVLRNERVRIERDGAALDLAGVDDWRARGMAHGHGPDLPRALQGRDKRVPVVLLAHQPKAVFEAAEHGVALQISGHTHGGQLMPFQHLVKLDQPAVAGLHRFGETWLYVSRGTGYWGPPLRVGVPAEIAVIELETA